MATDTVLSLSKNRNVTRQILDQIVTLRAFIDTTVTPLAAADVYPLFDYDANTYIKEANIIVDTVEDAADTLDLLDAVGGSALINDRNMSSVGAGTKYSTGIIMTSAGKITLGDISAAITACKFWVVVEMVKLKETD